MREKIKSIVLHNWFQNFIIALIILNGVTLGLETYSSVIEKYGTFIKIFDTFVITIFTIEIILRIYVHKIDFFKDGWSLFDFFIVIISLLPTDSGFEIFRILRVLRIFRLITVVPQMRKVVTALLSTIPGMLSVAGLMILFFYIFAIMATQLYGKTFPQWFGDLGESFYTLFQVMTLESWSMGIVRPLMEQHPYAWIFFIPFIFIVTFIMINLIVAIVVDAMNELSKNSQNIIENDIQKSKENMISEIQALKEEIRQLKDILQNRP